MSLKWNSIKVKYPLGILGIFIFAIGIIVWMAYENGISKVKHETDALLTLTAKKFNQLILDESNVAHTEALFFSALPEAYNAYKTYQISGNLDSSILDLKQSTHRYINTVYADSHKRLKIHYHLPQGISFFRSWSNKRGDDISSFRKSVLEVNKTKKSMTGIEVGRAGLVIRAVVPIFDHDASHSVLGSVESILPMNVVYDAFKQDTLISIAVFMDSSLLHIATKFKSISSVKGGDYHFNGGVFVSASKGFNFNILPQLEKNKESNKNIIHLKNFTAIIIPVKDMFGKTVAYSLLTINIKHEKDKVAHVAINTFLLLFTSALLLMALILFILNRITTTINTIKSLSHKIVDGDIRDRIEIDSNDEIGELGKAINKVSDEIGSLIKRFRESIMVLNKNSEESSQLSSLLASSAEELSVQVADTKKDSTILSDEVANIGEATSKLSAGAQDILEKSNNVSSYLQNNIADLDESTHMIEQATQASTEITSAATELSDMSDKNKRIAQEAIGMVSDVENNINQLETLTNSIYSVVSVVTTIAEQTKLLALNATIEAARAGESGKGFAVVANEVKDLAVQTNKATTQIQDEIDAIKHSTENTSKSMQKMRKTMDSLNESNTTVATAVEEQGIILQENNRNLESAKEYLMKTITEIHSSTDLLQKTNETIFQLDSDIKSIDSAVLQSQNTVSHILESIGQVSIVANQSSEAAQDIKQSADSLEELSQNISTYINRYKTE